MVPLDYITPSESKQTVEKPVKEKPSTKDLTTIEKPGKQISADEAKEFEEDKPKRKRRTRKTPTASTTKIKKAKKDSILIITEKPQAALKIASALGNPNKYSENRAPFYELQRGDDKIIVTSAVGHLFNLTYAEGQRGWPIFEMKWIPSYKKFAFTKNYYELIKKLSVRAKEFVIATDFDTEGEVIGWNALRFIAKQKDAKRMKFSTLTKNELIKAYENLLPTLDWGQAYAGETRHQLDWLYGINLSRALMEAIKRTGTFKILSIGRVQGPALKIIVEREHEIQKFTPEPYWQVFALIKNLALKHPKDIFDKSLLEEFKNLKEGKAKTTEKEEVLPPPPPFDLTSLQRESYAFHKISPSNTLKTAQSLYLDGLISYPRTSSQKIPKEIEPKKILKALEKRFPEVKLATRPSPVEGKKSDPAHPSIYPTGEFKSLPEGSYEEKIYNLIAKRFISCFSPDALIKRKRISLNAEGKLFTTSGANIIEKGWMKIYPTKIEERSLPDINGKTKIDKIKFEEKETQPPRRYTPTSLITILEKKNLGTKTTRSSIIDTLFNRGYLDGKSIKATPLGISLIKTLEKYSPIILDENLTKNLEEKMQEILDAKSKWQDKEKETIKSVEKLLTDISKEFKAKELQIGKSLKEGIEELREKEKEQNTLMPCPVCKKGNLIIRYSKKFKTYFVGCDAYPDCTTTYSLPPNALIKNTGKTNDENLPILVAIRKAKRPWEFPFDPHWKEKQEKEEKKKQEKKKE